MIELNSGDLNPGTEYTLLLNSKIKRPSVEMPCFAFARFDKVVRDYIQEPISG